MKKDDAKKEYFLAFYVDSAITFVKKNAKLCIGSAVGVVVVIALIVGHFYYEGKRNERLQYNLSKSIASFEEYIVTGKEDTLKKAREDFGAITREKQKSTYLVAKLYLGKIASLEGKTEEARKLFNEAMKDGKGTLIETLAEKALENIQRK